MATQIVYTATVGNLTTADLQTRVAGALAPLDTDLLSFWGLRFVSDVTGSIGAVITRTITVSMVPAVAGTIAVAITPGENEGPIISPVVTAAGSGYVRPPVLAVVGNGVNAKLSPTLGVVGISGLVGGAAYGAAAQVVATGGQLAPGGVQATFNTTVAVGVIGPVTVATAGGPYNIPPVLSVINTGGGAGFSALALLGLTVPTIVSAGKGYSAVAVTVTPFFKAALPDTVGLVEQASSIFGFMDRRISAAARSPVNSTTVAS
jgi:hypothetical protein